MHGYSGNPALFPATIDLGDDSSDPPTFITWNIGFEGLADRTAWLFATSRSPNWLPSQLPSVSGGPFVTLACVGYDALTQKWIFGGVGPGGPEGLGDGYGDPSGWTALPLLGSGGPLAGGSYRGIVRGNEPSVSSKYLYAAYVDGAPGHLKLQRTDTVGAVSVLTSSSPAGTATNVVDGQLATVPGVIIVALSTTLAANSNIVYTTDSGNTWTAGYLPGVAVGAWCLASNPANQVLAIPGITGSGGGPTYVSSPDGTTWTPQTGLYAHMTASEVPTALVWGDDGAGTGCWIVTTFDTSAHMYLSYDGVSWSVITNDWPAAATVDGLAYLSDARILIAMIRETPLARVVYSLNGGQHWSSCRLEAAIVSTVSSLPTAHKLVSGPNQAAIACGALLLLSTAIGDPGGVGSV